MKLISFSFMVVALSLCDSSVQARGYDLTVVGQVKFSGSLDRLPISLTNLLKDDLGINFIPTPNAYDFNNVPEPVEHILKNPDKTPGKVAFLFDVLWAPWKSPADFVPEESIIKIAYSVLESTKVPEEWVKILNEKFDVVVVADEYYLPMYKNSGVKIPIFVLPHGIEIDNLLAEPFPERHSEYFTFGCSAAFWERKNQLTLIEAFDQEFKDEPHVFLKLHGRYSTNDSYFHRIQERLKKLKNKRIELFYETLSPEEYKEFLISLDCYVLISKGEGFSITPREALALGKPCILSDNTAHKTLCNTGFVYSLPSEIEEQAAEDGSKRLGYHFNCRIEDVRKALRDLYDNYESHLRRASKARTWVKTYRWQNLKSRFLTLIKPKNVILGHENRIADDYLMTSSPDLFSKYKLITQSYRF